MKKSIKKIVSSFAAMAILAGGAAGFMPTVTDNTIMASAATVNEGPNFTQRTVNNDPRAAILAKQNAMSKKDAQESANEAFLNTWVEFRVRAVHNKTSAGMSSVKAAFGDRSVATKAAQAKTYAPIDFYYNGYIKDLNNKMFFAFAPQGYHIDSFETRIIRFEPWGYAQGEKISHDANSCSFVFYPNTWAVNSTIKKSQTNIGLVNVNR